MKSERRRIKLLKRMGQLRRLETMNVQRELVQAQQFGANAREMQSKTSKMAQAYSSASEHENGAGLKQSLGLAAELSKLSQTARKDALIADERIERSSVKIAQLDQRQERLDQQIAEAKRDLDAKMHKAQSEMSSLARQLLKDE